MNQKKDMVNLSICTRAKRNLSTAHDPAMPLTNAQLTHTCSTAFP